MPTRTASASACSWKNGSFIVYSACSAVMVSGRCAGDGVGVGAVEQLQEGLAA